MNLFDTYLIPPSSGQLDLLRGLLVMTYAFYLPYLGLVGGATMLSLTFNYRDHDIPNSTFARMAKDLMDIAVPNRWVTIVLGVLPLVVLWMVYGEWLAKSAPSTFWLFPVGGLLITLSFVAISAYRKTLHPEGRNSMLNFGLGGVGLATFTLGVYILIGVITRFNDPERWFLDQGPIRLMLSFNIIWRFNLLMISGLAFTCVSLLFFYFVWPSTRQDGDADYSSFVKKFSSGTALVTTLLIPVMHFFWIVTVPFIAHSAALFSVSVAIVAVLFLAFLLLYGTTVSPRPRFGAATFVLFLVFFGLSGFSDQITLVNATKEHSAALVAEYELLHGREVAEREAERADGMTIDPAMGEEVFTTICSTCHKMDERVVGPPLSAVLPKYTTVDALVEFLKAPKKVNAEYPPMPAPAISVTEMKAVAIYLLGESAVEPTGDDVNEH